MECSVVGQYSSDTQRYFNVCEQLMGKYYGHIAWVQACEG